VLEDPFPLPVQVMHRGRLGMHMIPDVERESVAIQLPQRHRRLIH
jgi:hypothetical protein